MTYTTSGSATVAMRVGRGEAIETVPPRCLATLSTSVAMRVGRGEDIESCRCAAVSTYEVMLVACGVVRGEALRPSMLVA